MMIKKIQFILFLFSLNLLFGQVLITDSSEEETPHESTILELKSDGKGVLFPKNIIKDYRSFSDFSSAENGLFFFDEKTERLVMKGEDEDGQSRWYASYLFEDNKYQLNKLDLITAKSDMPTVVSSFPDPNVNYGYIYPGLGRSNTDGWTYLNISNTVKVKDDKLRLYIHANGIASIKANKPGGHSGFGFMVGIFIDGHLAQVSKFYKEDNFKECNSMKFEISAKASFEQKNQTHEIKLYVRNLKKQSDNYDAIIYGRNVECVDGQSNNVSDNTYLFTETLKREEFDLPKIKYDPSCWMKQLDNSTLLKNLTICGAHDAGTFTLSSITGFGFAKTQDASFVEQLNKGVRYLDIRLYYDERRGLYIYHGGFSTGLRFKQDVLPTLFNFLLENPSETIFMVVKNENDSNMPLWYRAVFKLLNKYRNKIYTDFDVNKTTINDVRGKIVLISRERLMSPYLAVEDNRASLATFKGIRNVYFQDVYKTGVNYSGKLNLVKEYIKKAQNISVKNDLVINNFNATFGGTPGAVAKYINSEISKYLSTHIVNPEEYLNPPRHFVSKRLGYLIMDFVTSPQAEPILDYAIRQSILANNTYYQDLYSLNVGYVP